MFRSEIFIRVHSCPFVVTFLLVLRNQNTRLVLGLLAGIALGIGLHAWGEVPLQKGIIKNVLEPVGQVFLRGLFMVVVPLVFCSLALGVAQLGSLPHVARLGRKLILFYMCTSLVAILIGQFLVTTIKPGQGVSKEFADDARVQFSGQVAGLMEKSAGVQDSLWPGIISQIIPKNIVQALAEGQMLAIIFVALVFGATLLVIDPKKSAAAKDVLGAVSDAALLVVGWIMKLAPFAVAALMAVALSRFGVQLLNQLALYVTVVVLGYAIHFFGVYALIVRFVLRMPVIAFYKTSFPVFATAFGTSSSNATIPTTIRTLEKDFKVPESVTSFTVPLGATVNMDGTALFEAVAVIFVGQVFGIELSLLQHVSLVLMVFLTAIGVAGIPGGSIPIIMSIMASFGIPPEGIALVLGVDRLLDMGRTVLNVTGDLLCALLLSKGESTNVARLET